MKRQILTGLAVAGALTLWVGSSAFASEPLPLRPAIP